MTSRHSDSIQDWLVSNQLYEDNLFYYALIICFWFFWGFAFLGFELQGFSPEQNLFFNFIYYLIICVCMALCPVWFKLFFGKTHTTKQEQELNAHLNELDDDERQEVIGYLSQTGQLAMRPAQRWALVFLGSYFLFEVFFISAWVKDLALVWEPRWASVLIEWVKQNTTVPPLNVDRKLFILDVSDKVFEYTNFTTEQEFMRSKQGEATLLYRAIRSFNFTLIMMSIAIICWRVLDCFGMQKADHYIDSLWKFLWMSILSVFMILFIFGGIIGGIMSINILVPYIHGKYGWLNLFWQNVIYIFVLFSIKMLSGWLFFGKVYFLNTLRSEL